MVWREPVITEVFSVLQPSLFNARVNAIMLPMSISDFVQSLSPHVRIENTALFATGSARASQFDQGESVATLRSHRTLLRAHLEAGSRVNSETLKLNLHSLDS